MYSADMESHVVYNVRWHLSVQSVGALSEAQLAQIEVPTPVCTEP